MPNGDMQMLPKKIMHLQDNLCQSVAFQDLVMQQPGRYNPPAEYSSRFQPDEMTKATGHLIVDWLLHNKASSR